MKTKEELADEKKNQTYCAFFFLPAGEAIHFGLSSSCSRFLTQSRIFMQTDFSPTCKGTVISTPQKSVRHFDCFHELFLFSLVLAPALQNLEGSGSLRVFVPEIPRL